MLIAVEEMEITIKVNYVLNTNKKKKINVIAVCIAVRTYGIYLLYYDITFTVGLLKCLQHPQNLESN